MFYCTDSGGALGKPPAAVSATPETLCDIRIEILMIISANCMFHPFWYYLNSDSKETDNLFLIIGKSLYISSRYESYCKTLRTLLDIKEQRSDKSLDYSDEEQMNLLFEFINKRNLNDHIRTIISKYSSNESILEILNEAKNKRNYIAHELTVGLEQNIDNDNNIYEIITESLKESLMILLEAEFIIILSISYMTNDDRPPSNYINDNYYWVFKENINANVT